MKKLSALLTGLVLVFAASSAFAGQNDLPSQFVSFNTVHGVQTPVRWYMTQDLGQGVATYRLEWQVNGRQFYCNDATMIKKGEFFAYNVSGCSYQENCTGFGELRRGALNGHYNCSSASGGPFTIRANFGLRIND